MSVADIIKTAIVCSNNPGLRSELVSQLKKLGIVCYRSTPNGRACYDELLDQHERCDLIVTDVVLDDMHARDLISKIRSRSKLSKVHVVVLANDNERDQVEKCLEVGITSFVFKPVTESRFHSELRNVFAKYRHYATENNVVHDLAAARFYWTTKNFRMAVTLYEQVLEFGRNAEILFELGQIYGTLRNKTQALKCFREAIDLDPSFKLDIAEFLKRNPLEDERAHKNQISEKAISLFEQPVELPAKQFYGKERIVGAAVGAKTFNVRSPVRGMLRDMGIAQVESDSKGEEIFRLLRARSIDLVVIEVRLDDVNALQLIELIRKDIQFDKVKILILMDNKELANIRKAFELGADGFCQKPYSTTSLQQSVHEMMLLDDMTVRSGERRRHLKAAFACYKAGRFEDAYAVIKEVSEENHEDSFACLIWAMLLHRIGHETQAETYYQLATELNPQFIDLAFRLREHVEKRNQETESNGRANINLDDIKFGALELEASMAEAELDATELELVSAGEHDIMTSSSESMSNVIALLEDEGDIFRDSFSVDSVDFDAIIEQEGPVEDLSKVDPSLEPARLGHLTTEPDEEELPITQRVSKDLALKEERVDSRTDSFPTSSSEEFATDSFEPPPSATIVEEKPRRNQRVQPDTSKLSIPPETIFEFEGEATGEERSSATQVDWVNPDQLKSMQLPSEKILEDEGPKVEEPDEDWYSSLVKYRRQIIAICEQGSILISRLENMPDTEDIPIAVQEFLCMTARVIAAEQDEGRLPTKNWRDKWEVKKLRNRLRKENGDRAVLIDLGASYIQLRITTDLFEKVLKFWKEINPNAEGVAALPPNSGEIRFLTRAVLKLDHSIMELHQSVWDGFHNSRETLDQLVEAFQEGDEVKVQELNRILAKDHWSLSMFKEIYRSLTETNQSDLRDDFFESNADQYSKKRSIRDNLGEFFTALKSLKHANHMFEISHKHNSRNIDYLHKLAINSIRMERYKEAQDWGKKMVKIDYQNPEGYNVLGVSNKKLGKLKDSVKHYKKGLKYTPDSSKLAHNLAIAYAALGDVKHSALYHQKAKRLEEEEKKKKETEEQKKAS